MKIRNFIIITAITLVSLTFNGCGKTDTDKEWEETLIGYWIPQDESGNKWDPCYLFKEGHRGESFIRKHPDNRDEFGWEIKRKQLKTFYDKAPSYLIGYDKYNRQGVYKIKSVEQDKIKVIQMTSDGLQREYFLVRGNINDIEDNEDN
ncbi:MAG: hypothetical protein LBQ22_00210 [Bacteroidales bacterium]|jgi:hypothetical protein|nr:hypothetical protein [Bacteroidales bacterium]